MLENPFPPMEKTDFISAAKIVIFMLYSTLTLIFFHFQPEKRHDLPSFRCFSRYSAHIAPASSPILPQGRLAHYCSVRASGVEEPSGFFSPNSSAQIIEPLRFLNSSASCCTSA